MMIIDQKEKNISYLVNIALKKKSKKGDFQKQFSHEEKHLLKEKKKKTRTVVVFTFYISLNVTLNVKMI